MVPLREEQQYLDDVEDKEVEFARACPSTRSGPASSCLDAVVSTAYKIGTVDTCPGGGPVLGFQYDFFFGPDPAQGPAPGQFFKDVLLI